MEENTIKNIGKIFEDDFKQSLVSEKVWYKRLNDNASSWAGGSNTRFASTNECDYLMFDNDSRTLYALELKSVQKSATFWREDFEDKEKHQTFVIKKNQILGLSKWSSNTMVCGFIINFREEDNRTFFIMVDEFIDYTNKLDKKSININDVLEMNPIEIKSIKKRTRYRYDIGEFISATKL